MILACFDHGHLRRHDSLDEAGDEIRIDEDFHLEPPPKPEWVQNLERNG